MTTVSRGRQFTYNIISTYRKENRREHCRWFARLDFCRSCLRLMTSQNTAVYRCFLTRYNIIGHFIISRIPSSKYCFTFLVYTMHNLDKMTTLKLQCVCVLQPAFSALTLLAGCQEEHLDCKKIEWWDAGAVIGLKWGANDLHIVQLMPLPPHHLLLH